MVSIKSFYTSQAVLAQIVKTVSLIVFSFSLFVSWNQKGGESIKTKNTDIIMQNKVFLWVALVTGIILSIPLMAMQFTNEVKWTLSDFVIMGTLLFITGSLFVLVARKTPKHRVIVGLAFTAALLWLWAELAVGIFTNWGS